MSELLPAGMIRFRAALARAAEALCPEAWAMANAKDREFLTDVDEAFGFAAERATGRGSLAQEAYHKLRPLLAEGTLPASERGLNGPPQAIEPAWWTSSAADRLRFIVSGKALIRETDLASVLKGEPAPGYQPPAQSKEKISSNAKRGRPQNPDADRFWIEAGRRVYIGQPLDPLAAFVTGMAEWCASHMASPYDEETVRKKLAQFVRELKRSGPD